MPTSRRAGPAIPLPCEFLQLVRSAADMAYLSHEVGRWSLLMRSVSGRWLSRPAPVFHCLLWLGFLLTFCTSGVAERQLAALRAAALPAVPALRLEIQTPGGAAAAYQYEIGLSIAEQLPSSFVVAAPRAARPPSAANQPAAITLRGALASWDPAGVLPLPLQVQIAARDAAGCIVYGGERRLIFSATPASAGPPSPALLVRVILQRLPQSICT